MKTEARPGDGLDPCDKWALRHAPCLTHAPHFLPTHVQVKALSEELENPLNVHRWRKLEGSDPSTYEMIQKIQTLQKRLIAKTEEVVEKDLLIQEKEKLYMELKNILARQPGPEVAEQLSIYQVGGGCVEGVGGVEGASHWRLGSLWICGLTGSRFVCTL